MWFFNQLCNYIYKCWLKYVAITVKTIMYVICHLASYTHVSSMVFYNKGGTWAYSSLSVAQTRQQGPSHTKFRKCKVRFYCREESFSGWSMDQTDLFRQRRCLWYSVQVTLTLDEYSSIFIHPHFPQHPLHVFLRHSRSARCCQHLNQPRFGDVVIIRVLVDVAEGLADGLPLLVLGK